MPWVENLPDGMLYDLGMYRTCYCGTYIRHWQWYSGNPYGRWTPRRLPQRCAVVGCSNPPEVGAHVRFVDEQGRYGTGYGRQIYILPFCRQCNSTGHNLEAWADERYSPARASIPHTCGR